VYNVYHLHVCCVCPPNNTLDGVIYIFPE